MSNSSVCSKRRPRPADQAEAVRLMAGKIYPARRPHLLSVARRNAACEADAEEAVQEAFVAFIESYDPDGGVPPLAWLTLVVKRKCWRAKEARRRVVGELLPGAEADAVRPLVASGRRHQDDLVGVEADQGTVDRQHRIGLAHLSPRRDDLLAAQLGERPFEPVERTPGARVDIAGHVLEPGAGEGRRQQAELQSASSREAPEASPELLAPRRLGDHHQKQVTVGESTT
jgi:DNA-directed RNA polymerase specialized sigma24 family protein